MDMIITVPNRRWWTTRILASTILFTCQAKNCFAQEAPPDSVLAILFQDDPLPADAVKLKSISLGGNDYTDSCAYYELLLKAKNAARDLGANLLKLDARHNHSKTQHCDALDLSFYIAAAPHEAEQSFTWNVARPLTWDDFRGRVRAGTGPKTAAETNCGIAVETNLVMNGGIAKVYVFNTFDKRTSWVKEGMKLPEVLEHEQGHWNICELYTRRMQARFDALKITGIKLQSTVREIYDAVSRDYLARQELYEQETQHGTIAADQKRWTELIDTELNLKLTRKL